VSACDDLKLLGKLDFKNLLKWRTAVLRDARFAKPKVRKRCTLMCLAVVTLWGVLSSTDRQRLMRVVGAFLVDETFRGGHFVRTAARALILTTSFACSCFGTLRTGWGAFPGCIRCSHCHPCPAETQVRGEDEESEEEKAPPAPVGTEAEQRERKLLEDIDAAVQKEAARQRRLKKTEAKVLPDRFACSSGLLQG
jgi:hypothetical protein